MRTTPRVTDHAPIKAGPPSRSRWHPYPVRRVCAQGVGWSSSFGPSWMWPGCLLRAVRFGTVHHTLERRVKGSGPPLPESRTYARSHHVGCCLMSSSGLHGCSPLGLHRQCRRDVSASWVQGAGPGGYTFN